MAGRQQVRQIVDLLREAHSNDANIALTALPASIGIRETNHAQCSHQLKERDLLNGVSYHDCIAKGSYRVDVHHQGGDGLTFRYLDGREVFLAADGSYQEGRWTDPANAKARHYEIPYRSLIPQNPDSYCPSNLWVAGRHIDADEGAFGAIRVCVNCNQMGEAAGVAAALALKENCPAAEVPIARLQDCLANS